MNDKEIGMHEARLDAHNDRIGRLEGQLASIESKLDAVLETVSNAKFGVRLLWSIGAVATAMGGFAVGVIHWLSGRT